MDGMVAVFRAENQSRGAPGREPGRGRFAM